MRREAHLIVLKPVILHMGSFWLTFPHVMFFNICSAFMYNAEIITFATVARLALSI